MAQIIAFPSSPKPAAARVATDRLFDVEPLLKATAALAAAARQMNDGLSGLSAKIKDVRAEYRAALA